MSCLSEVSSIDVLLVDNIFVKSMEIDKAGHVVRQHSHLYDHVTMVAKGGLRVWANDKLIGDFYAPNYVLIPKDTKHKLVSLVDNTIAYCLHNTHGDSYPVVIDEHALEETDCILEDVS